MLDPRNGDWLLMSSPFPTLILLAMYLTIVRYGPKFMEKRPALKARWPLVAYNSFITALNAWMAHELLTCGLVRNYNFICQLVDTSDNEYEVRVRMRCRHESRTDFNHNQIARAIWWYYFSKLLEFMDTIFFIWRKKPRQLTFLHVYHHGTMFLFWWVGARFVPGGSALSGAMVNCFVHVIMYAYYAMAAMGPRVQRYLWWKKYLTILQLGQFTLGVVLGLNAILTNCQFTRWMQYVFVCYAFSFIVLFSKFYQKEYGEEKTSTTGKKKPKVKGKKHD